MEWLTHLIDWASKNGELLVAYPSAFIAFAVIEAAILLLILRILYSDKLKDLPNLMDIKDKLRQAQEDNCKLSAEDRRLHTEIKTLQEKVRALQSDKELLTGMESEQAAETIGEKVSKALSK